MRILITARELMDRHLWDRACDMTGRSPWAVNEGQMDSSDEMTLTEDQARELGLLAVGPAQSWDAVDEALGAAIRAENER